MANENQINLLDRALGLDAPDHPETIVSDSEKTLQPGGGGSPATASAIPGSNGKETSSVLPAQPVQHEPVRQSTPRWLYVGRISPKHKADIAAGKTPAEIKHHAGFYYRCQCEKCKTKRGEFASEAQSLSSNEALPPPSLPGVAPPTVDNFFSELFDEELCAKVATTPQRIAQLVMRYKEKPEKMIQILDLDPSGKVFLGKSAKACVDKYMKMPDFEHKELVAFLVGYSLITTEQAAAVLIALKMEKANDGHAK